jgi:hypothetical protein
LKKWGSIEKLKMKKGVAKKMRTIQDSENRKKYTQRNRNDDFLGAADLSGVIEEWN